MGTTEILEGNLAFGTIFNTGAPEYEARVLTTQPRRSVLAWRAWGKQLKAFTLTADQEAFVQYRMLWKLS
jgi:hypothetical protein